MVLGDFNGDGYLDLVYYGYTSTETYLALSFLQGNGDGTFQPPVAVLLPAGYVNAMVAADINANGKLDLIAAVQIAGASVGAEEGGAWVWLGNGDGTFQGPTEYSTDSASSALAAQDFNADGQLDVVLGDSTPNEFFTFFGNGDCTLQKPHQLPARRIPICCPSRGFQW